MDLQLHYKLMNEEALESFQEDRYQIDHLIDSNTDSRFGLTLLIRLSEPIKRNIQGLLSDLSMVEPNQYYYPDSDLHITALTLISCYTGFGLSKIDPNQYIDLLNRELQAFQPFRIECKGAIFSKTGVLIKGFPDPALGEIRDKLRFRFKDSELLHSIDSRYAIRTAHITAMRFRRQIANKKELIRKVRQYEYTNFGTLEVKALELVFNDWYQRHSRTKRLYTFSFNR